MEYNLCELCPRKCKVNRNGDFGFCKAGSELKIAKAFVHLWEEPCISGESGSGAIFFSNCNLQCVFCQNYNISHEGYGKVISIERLAQIMLELQEKKSNNINLVTPSLYIPLIKSAIQIARTRGLNIPIIYNSSGYEDVSALRELEGLIDIYLPDIKYYDDKYSVKYSKAPNYFEYTSKAIFEMLRQVGTPLFENEMLKKGVMIRHLMLPGLLFDSKKIIDWVVSELPKEIYFNIMCQYTPMGEASKFPEINKKINKKHYEALLDYAISNGIENGFFQDFESASDEYTPDFNLDGV
jgi:putative pyruvate formate lyase activating enzyme